MKLKLTHFLWIALLAILCTNRLFAQSNTPNNAANTPAVYTTLTVQLLGGGGLAQWRLANAATWRNSGDTARLLSGYYYSIFYQNVNTWYAPTQNTVFINPNRDTVINAAYTPIPYHWLKVKLTGGDGQGRWVEGNRTTRYKSNDSLAIPVGGGTYISYTDVNGCVKPEIEDFIATDTNRTTTWTRNYYKMKNIKLKVLLTGANGQGQWSLDGSSWSASGDTIRVSNNYTYVLYSKDISGFITPVSYYFIAKTENDTTVTLNYIPITYKNVRVNLVGANNQGRFKIYGSGGNVYQNSSTTIRLETNTNKNYTINCEQVSGWIKPNNVSFYFDTDQDTAFTLTYILIQYGVLKVNITGANGGGQWSVDGSNIFKNSGDTIRLAANTSRLYSIGYKEVGGWITPGQENIYMTANQTDTLNRTYIALQYSALKVHLTGANAQGAWQIDGGVWRNSDDTIHLVYNNQRYYTIRYKTVSGWISPVEENIVPTNRDTVFNRAYSVIQYGVLKVDITGGGGKGKWTVDYVRWNKSGDTLVLPTHLGCSVVFKNIAGWNAPNYITNIQIIPNQTQTYTATYLYRNDPLIQVHITGAEGQAQWYLNSNEYNILGSGDSTYSPIGSSWDYVQFKPVFGWITPNNIAFNPTQNNNQTFTANYVLGERTIFKVNLEGGGGEGRWSIDSIRWLKSGDTLTMIPKPWGTFIYIKNLPYWNFDINQIRNTSFDTREPLNEYTFKYTLPLVSTNLSANIAPNPANNYVDYTTFSTDKSSILYLKVFNTLGEIMLDAEIVANSKGRLNTTDLPTGFYFINIYEPNNKGNIIKKIYVRHQ